MPAARSAARSGLAQIEALLRSEGPHAVSAPRVPWRALLTFASGGAFLYGFAMGSWGGRPLQMLYSGLKVPLLLAITASLCLPSFWVLNTLLGLRDDFARAFRGVLAAQSVGAVALCSLAPLAVLANHSLFDYHLVTLFHGSQFAIATLFGHVTLTRHYRPLVRKNSRHRLGKLAWLGLSTFVAIQLAWVLRPFIGALDQPTEFTREGAWSNAYLRIYQIIENVLSP